MPFNIRNPIGFYIALVLPILCSCAYLSIVAVFSVLFITVCTYIETLVKDLSMIVSVMNKDIRKNPNARIKHKEFLELTVACSRLLKVIIHNYLRIFLSIFLFLDSKNDLKIFRMELYLCSWWSMSLWWLSIYFNLRRQIFIFNLIYN